MRLDQEDVLMDRQRRNPLGKVKTARESSDGEITGHLRDLASFVGAVTSELSHEEFAPWGEYFNFIIFVKS